MSRSSPVRKLSARNIFDSRYYRMNKILMTTVGVWPYQRCKDRYVRVAFLTGCMFSCLISQAYFIANSLDDWDAIIECAAPSMTLIGALIKYYTCIRKINKFTQTMSRVQRNWKDCNTAHERRILGSYALVARKRTLIYVGYLYSTSQIYSLISILPYVLDVIDPLNESRSLKPVMLVDFGVDQEKNFFLIWLHSYVIIAIAMTVTLAHDTMHGGYIEHACGIFDIIGHRLKNVANCDRRTVILKPTLKEDVDHQNVIACIRTHKEILEFSSALQDIYSEPLLWQLVLGALIVSISLAQCVIKIGDSMEVARYTTFVVAHVTHLLFNNLPGQRLIDHSQAVGQYAGNVAWYNISMRARKLLLLIFMRSAIPCRITAGKFYTMCLENFCTVIQTSVSYFMALMSTR